MVGGAGRVREPLRARVVLRAEPGGAWLGDVELAAAGARETRRLEGASCRQVADAIVVMIALAVAAEPAGPGPSEPPPAAAPPPPPPPAKAPPRERPTSALKAFGVGLSGALDVGTLPAAALGGEIRLDWEPPHADLGLVAAVSSTTKGTLSGDASQGAEFWLARLRVRGCYPMFGGRVAVGPCASLGMEAVFASGFGPNPRNATAWLATVSLGGQVVFWLTSALSIRLVGEGIATAPSGVSFIITNAGQVHQLQPVAFSGAAGGEIHF